MIFLIYLGVKLSFRLNYLTVLVQKWLIDTNFKRKLMQKTC